ncbi:MAG: WD40 repeat domain-containing protein, partial [Nostoc sp.]
PATQALELRILPILPMWLQLTLLAILAGLFALLLKPEAIAHTKYVNAVRFSANALSVVSGSDDSTIRLWRINNNNLEAEDNNEPDKLKGVLGDTNKQAVFALRFDPLENNRVAAGLENGVIQLWNVARRSKEYELSFPEIVNKTDKVFDLVFTKNSQYLISGHGS